MIEQVTSGHAPIYNVRQYGDTPTSMHKSYHALSRSSISACSDTNLESKVSGGLYGKDRESDKAAVSLENLMFACVKIEFSSMHIS
jgi:hypothetical protein